MVSGASKREVVLHSTIVTFKILKEINYLHKQALNQKIVAFGLKLRRLHRCYPMKSPATLAQNKTERYSYSNMACSKKSIATTTTLKM